jgi:hypothetical protein
LDGVRRGSFCPVTGERGSSDGEPLSASPGAVCANDAPSARVLPAGRCPP